VQARNLRADLSGARSSRVPARGKPGV